jgi:hypothetical protein
MAGMPPMASVIRSAVIVPVIGIPHWDVPRGIDHGFNPPPYAKNQIFAESQSSRKV